MENSNKPSKPSQANEPYVPIADNWFKSLPYAFKAKIDGKMKIFYLPINPQNLTIITHYATNVISTLYDTIEEHSEQRYFDIAIQGTTGFAPLYVNASDTRPPKHSGRESYGYEAFLPINFAFGGFFSKTIGKLESAANQAKDFFAAIKGEGGNGFKPGVYNDTSGYIAFHNFYKFLLDYKRSAAAGQSISPQGPSDKINNKSNLYFVNYKDNNQYSCAVQVFTLERSAQNPMLYNYTIRLRAYNLTQIGAEDKKDDNLSDRVKALGLDGGASLFSGTKNIIGKAKGIINSVKGAFSTFGA